MSMKHPLLLITTNIMLLFTSLFSTNIFIYATKSSIFPDYFQVDEYSAAFDKITISENLSKTEPPIHFKPEGEKEFSDKQYRSLTKGNSEGTKTKSLSKYPYHRFDVLIKEEAKPTDRLSVSWQGKSLPGRKITMYGWNHMKKKWIELADTIAGKNEVTIQAAVSARDYLHHQRLSILVQDQIIIPTKKYDYSFVWMSDTQYYAQNYPSVFKSVTEWIAQNKEEMKIEYVFHTGDIVHKGNDEKQWQRASTYLNTLDVAKIPYGVLPGNHDVGSDFKKYKEYFGQERFQRKRYYGEAYENNRGHYDLVSVNGKEYLFLYMGWKVKKEDIIWMNNILRRYADRTAILAFHEYLEKDGSRSRKGNELFEKVVVPNRNVVAVLSGHYHGSEMLVDEVDDNLDGITDRKVYQLLADYQKAPQGGGGFIRLLHIDEETNSIDVQTYSPYLDQYYYYSPNEYPNKDQFTMDIDVTKSEKMIASSYFDVRLYRKIGKDNVVNKK